MSDSPIPTTAKVELPEPLPNHLTELIHYTHTHGISLKEEQLKYSGLVSNTDYGYMYLIHKYKSKCFLKGQIEYKNPFITYVGSDETITEELTRCIEKNTGIIFIPLGIHAGNSGHQNMIIYRPFIKKVERFEPYGSMYMPEYVSMDKALKQYFKSLPLPKLFTPIQYAAPLDVCTAPGFQELEEKIKSLKIEGLGYCQMWSLFVMETLLKNPTLKTVDIMNECYRISKNDPLYLKNLIRGYTTMISEEILRYSNVDLKNDNHTINYYTKYNIAKHAAVESAKKRTNTSDQRVVTEPEELIETEEHKRREFLDVVSPEQMNRYFNFYLKFIIEGFENPLLQNKYSLKIYLEQRGIEVEEFKRSAEQFIELNDKFLTEKISSLGVVPLNRLFIKYFPGKDVPRDKDIKVSKIVNHLTQTYTWEDFENKEKEILGR